MITLHEAIRNIQDELIKSEREREQKGIPRLFATEKLTIELSCVFSEMDSKDTKGGINAFSVLALDTASTNTVSSEKIQKVILEFKTVDAADSQNSKSVQNTENLEPVQNTENSGKHSIPPHSNSGIYPYGKD